MTTPIKVESTVDIFSANNVMNFTQVSDKGLALGGATWLTSGVSHLESVTTVLRFVYDLILNNLRSDKFWLLIGSSTWQQDTRIVRHKKLWGALKARGIEIAGGKDAKEIALESQGKIKFFGAICLTESSLESVAKAIAEEQCAYLVASSEKSTIHDVLEVGWLGDFRDDTYLRAFAAEHDVVLFKRIGEFDDPERGLAAIAKPQILAKLLS